MIPTHAMNYCMQTMYILRDRFGFGKVPLSYAIRDDPGTHWIRPLKNDNYVRISYGSLINKLTMHTLHSGSDFVEDNAKAFQITLEMVQGTSFESSIQSFQRSRDSCSAYKVLCQHTLRLSARDSVIEETENYVMK